MILYAPIEVRKFRMSNINWITVLLLFCSNFIMAYAWYGHMRNMQGHPILLVVLVSWLIALFEYCLVVPANRIGAKTMSLAQLKIVQEAISLLVFVPFSILVMKQGVNWNYAAAGGCILLAVFFIFRG